MKLINPSQPTLVGNAPQPPSMPIIGSEDVVRQQRQDQLGRHGQNKAFIFLAASVLLLGVYSFYFLYPKATLYFRAAADLSTMQSRIGQYQEVTLPNLEKEKDLHQAAYEKQHTEVIQSLSQVFPEGVDKRGIVSTLEDFAAKADALYPPFTFSAITLGESRTENGYVVTPISTSIKSSTVGFEKFLDFVNFSGRLDQEEKVRLMSISTIQVQYKGVDGGTGEDNGVTFSLQLNMYSRPQS